MATVNFILKKPKKKVVTPIIMVFAFGKKHIKIQLGTKAHPNAWNQEKARLRTTRNNDDATITNFNNRLESIEKSILACYNDHLTKNGTLEHAPDRCCPHNMPDHSIEPPLPLQMLQSPRAGHGSISFCHYGKQPHSNG
jgi:hypothetical protein